MQRFLGMAGYYRGFCRNLSSVAAPLADLVSPKLPFQWTASCQMAFESCKALLCSAPVLSAPDFSHPCALEVDASCIGAGADHGLDHPVGFYSSFGFYSRFYSRSSPSARCVIPQ